MALSYHYNAAATDWNEIKVSNTLFIRHLLVHRTTTSLLIIDGLIADVR